MAVTGNESDAALIITTLILATTFAPLKRALERFVERRFKARGDDAEAVGLAQSLGLEDEDLEIMLRRVVREEVRSALAPAPPTD